MQILDVTSNAKQPVVRISRGRFAPEKNDNIRGLIAESATTLAARADGTIVGIG